MSNSLNIATARAHSNIAFVKYWGNRENRLRLPSNASVSMNLGTLHTTTRVHWSTDIDSDIVTINKIAANSTAFERVSAHLDMLRRRMSMDMYASVESSNNFPMGTGIASSASAFAALSLAAVAAMGVQIAERELTTLARLGSGSAARSIPSGFVMWHAGDSHESSFAETFAEQTHWDLVDVIAIVSKDHKRVGSTSGHATAGSSILQKVRVQSAAERCIAVTEAILERDFTRFARIVEEDSNLMHAVMMTSRPPLFYWQPLSLAIMNAVRNWREDENLQVCYTLDAGPNVHCICTADAADEVESRLSALADNIDILRSGLGGGAYVLPTAMDRT